MFHPTSIKKWLFTLPGITYKRLTSIFPQKNTMNLPSGPKKKHLQNDLPQNSTSGAEKNPQWLHSHGPSDISRGYPATHYTPSRTQAKGPMMYLTPHLFAAFCCLPNCFWQKVSTKKNPTTSCFFFQRRPSFNAVSSVWFHAKLLHVVVKYQGPLPLSRLLTCTWKTNCYYDDPGI